MALITVPCIIRAGQSLSDICDCTAGKIVRFAMPPAWTPANLTFLLSTDGTIWSDLFSHNREVARPVLAGTTVIIKPDEWYMPAVAYLKLRSGSRKTPIVQPVDRVFILTLEGTAGTPEVPPATTELPVNVDAPAVTVNGSVVGSAPVGATLNCTMGNWSGEPTSYWYSWLSDSSVAGSGPDYVAQDTDIGHGVRCVVTATNAAGSVQRGSNIVTIT
jgi:hypothetical protein